MKIKIELTEADLKKLVMNHIDAILGGVSVREIDVEIMVKTNQNYKDEWEKGAFKAIVEKIV
jgi:hypothetical protein